MKLPQEYIDRMKELLKDEFEAFYKSYESDKLQGLRINTLKISVEDFLKISPFKLIEIPWCENGFYYEEGERPAKHPYYHAGLYYIQEPSAMAPVEILDVKSGNKVLDLCAAPGGKSIQICTKLKNEGVLVTNDINMNRVKAILKNVELFGIRNAIVTNETPKNLTRVFSNYFNRVLVDAPCSGEGMFRKDPSMIKNWKDDWTDTFAAIQREIMDCIGETLGSKGKMVYSTCTFAPEENEQMIHEFLNKNDEFNTIDALKNNGFSSGKPEWANNDQRVEACVRLWPHRLQGEGHFFALMEKGHTSEEKIVLNKEPEHIPLEDFHKFVGENLNISLEGRFRTYKENLYLVPKEVPSLKGLKVVRTGWLLGTYKKKRFEPSQALAMGITYKDAKRVVNFKGTDVEAIKYLKGETVNVSGEKGWTLVCVDHFPLGWAKQMGTALKNYYPASWRLL